MNAGGRDARDTLSGSLSPAEGEVLEQLTEGGIQAVESHAPKEKIEEMGTGQRRLGALMFTDVVGYTAHMQFDEQGAEILLDEHRRLLRSLFPEYGGTEIKTMGDGFLVEFASALEATQCAVAIQQQLHEQRLAGEPAGKLRVRIGIHLGDIEHRGDDILGDAVNVASRIQPLAEPDGICITQQVAALVQHRLPVPVVRLGKRRLKNVAQPVEIFRVDALHKASRDRIRPTMAAGRKRLLPLAASAVAVALVVAIGWWLTEAWRSPQAVPSVDASGVRSLAVLPFTDLSQAHDNEYFCDGLTEELINALAQIEGLRVIGRTSSFAFKEKEIGIRAIAEVLGVEAILEGSVRKEGNQLRITAQLIRASDEGHLWSSTYDRDLEGVFVVQESIAQSIVDHLSLQLAGGRPLVQPTTQSLEAYDLYLLGLWQLGRGTEEGYHQAIARFEQAIAVDETFARAHSGLADAYTTLVTWGILTPDEGFAIARGAAEKALALAPDLAEPYLSLGIIQLMYDWDGEAARQALESALRINPHLATVHVWYAVYLTSAGDTTAAVAHIHRALELEPLSTTIASLAGMVLFFAREYEEMISVLEKALELDPDLVGAHGQIASAYMHTDRWDEVPAEVAKDNNPIGALTIWAVYYAETGEPALARQTLEEVIDSYSEVAAYQIAIVYFHLDEIDLGFEWLWRAYRQRDAGLLWLKVDPCLDEYRSDPRFLSLLEAAVQ